MTALYRHRQDLIDLFCELEVNLDGDETAELPPDFANRLDALEGAFEDKATNIALYAQELRRNAEAADAESKRLAKMARARFNRFESLKDYLRANMELLDMKKLESPLVKIRIQKNSRPSIMWQGTMEELPEQYKRVVTTVDGDKAYQDYRNGVELTGFKVELGSHLRIA